MKKTWIAVSLLISMLLSLYTMPMVWAEDSFPYGYEASVVSQLGFFDISQSEDESVTRGEFLSAVMKILDVSEDVLDGNQYFYDVDADSVYFTEISNAVALKLISGYEDGNFGVEDGISYYDALSVMMRAAGYGVYAQENGGYPAGYARAARISNFSDYSQAGTNDVLTRGQVANMLYAFLNTIVFEPIGYGEYVTYTQSQTVMEYYQSMYKKSGFVNATFVSALWEYETTDFDKIMVGGTVYQCMNEQYTRMLGHYVDIIYHKNNDSTTPELLLMLENPDAKILKINASDITSYASLTYTYGERSRTATISPNHMLIINGKRIESYTEDDFVPINGTVTLVSDGTDSVYTSVIIDSFHSVVLERGNIGGTEIITFTEKYTYRQFEIDLSNKDQYVMLMMDGVPVPLKEFQYYLSGEDRISYTLPVVPQNSVLTMYCDSYTNLNNMILPAEDARYLVFDIITQGVSGTITAMYDDKVIIDETEYELATENTLQRFSTNFTPGAYGYFPLDCEGKVVGLIENTIDNDNLEYAYLINAVNVGSVFTPKLRAKILQRNGKIAEFEFASRVNVNGTGEPNGEKVLEMLQQSAKLLDSSFTISQLIKMKVNAENEIVAIETVLADVGIPDGAEKTHLRREIARTRLLARSDNGGKLYTGSSSDYPNTILYDAPRRYFYVPPTETFEDDDYSVSGSWTPNYGINTVDIFNCDAFRKPDICVIYQTPQDSALWRPNVMVDQVVYTMDSEGNPITELYCYDGTGFMTYRAEERNLFDGLKKGDIITLIGSGYRVSGYTKIFSVEEAKNFDLSTLPDPTKTVEFYELYAVSDDRKMVFQRGTLNADGTRSYQRGGYYNTDPLSFGGGTTLYDGENDGVVDLGFISDLKPANEFGNKESTKMLVSEDGGLPRFYFLFNNID